MKNSKIYLTITLVWIILIGYLVWANGLYARGDKSFRWDEWLWFGIIPALAPYFFWFIWKPNEIVKLIKCIKSAFSNNKSNEKEG